MKRLVRISIALFLCIAVCLFTTSGCAQDTGKAYTITEAYAYPVTSKDPAWKGYDSAQRHKLCNVPEETLRKMTTEALAETVINYPFFCDIYVYGTVEEGIRAVSHHFKGFEILLQRDDAYECIRRYDESLSDIDTENDFAHIHCTVLLQYLREKQK